MYKVTRKIFIAENRIHVGYGIKSPNHRFENISCEREKIERLCDLCNKLNIAEIHLKDVIEDFLYDFKVD